jgi:hypothetical protein
MRWLKHLTNAHNDPAISAIIEEFGLAGYGAYWLILEHLAVGVEKDSEAIPSATHSVGKWSHICFCSTRFFRKFAQSATELKLIECRTQAELKQFSSRTQAVLLQIDVPKLLKYRDEWSRRSGVTTEQSSSAKNSSAKLSSENIKPPQTPSASPPVSVENHAKNGNSKPPDEVEIWFKEFWKIYPRGEAPKKALASARKELKSEESRQIALAGLKKQLPGMLEKEMQFRPQASTWINQHRWEDEPPELFPVKRKQNGVDTVTVTDEKYGWRPD